MCAFFYIFAAEKLFGKFHDIRSHAAGCPYCFAVAEYQIADIRPAVRTKFRGKAISLPVLKDVPVFVPGTRSAGITWPISAGDECLVIFADLPIDAWLFGEEEEVSSSSRQHDLSDAFAFVGFRSKPNALPSFPDAPSFFGQESDS